MKVRYLAEARTDVREVKRYYNDQRPGLGREFADEVRAAVGRIRENPHAWQALDASVRRCRTNRFPYGVVYRIENHDVRIISVAHLHRKPEHWRDRL